MAKKKIYTEAEMRARLVDRIERAEQLAEQADETETETKERIVRAQDREEWAARGFRRARRRSLRTWWRVALWVVLVAFSVARLVAVKAHRRGLEWRLERARQESRRQWSAKYKGEERLEAFEAEVRRRYRRRAEKLEKRYGSPALVADRYPQNARELGLVREWLAGAAARREAYRLSERHDTPEEAKAMRQRIEDCAFKRYERELLRSEGSDENGGSGLKLAG